MKPVAQRVWVTCPNRKAGLRMEVSFFCVNRPNFILLWAWLPVMCGMMGGLKCLLPLLPHKCMCWGPISRLLKIGPRMGVGHAATSGLSSTHQRPSQLPPSTIMVVALQTNQILSPEKVRYATRERES